MRSTLFKSKHLFFALLTTLSITFANNPDPIVNLYEQYFNSYAQEKVYVHLNASVYHQKQSIWYKVYLKNTSNLQNSTNSNLVHVELVDEKGKVIIHQKIYMGKDAQNGDIYLDEKLASGTYTLRAYTNWMRNFSQESLFKKEIKIIEEDGFEIDNKKIVNQTVDLQFLPEGGYLVNDLPSILAFKAIDNNGNGVMVEGTIFDDQNNPVSEFKTHQLGFGKINFTPTPGVKYYASIAQNNTKYNLPQPLENGYVLGIQKNNENFALLSIKTNIAGGLTLGRIIGLHRDQIFFQYEITESENEINLKIPTNQIENGIAKIVFFDKNLTPQCERMFFINNETKNINTNIEIATSTTSKRSKQTIQFGLSNALENNFLSNASVTVINKDNFTPSKNNIKTHFLLSADLKGKIENPNYYFENYDAKKRYLLDLLMLTQGWSRYNTKDVLNTRKFKPKFNMEKGISIEGSVSLFKNPISQVQSKVSINSFDKGFFNDEVETDIKGRFRTQEYIFFDKHNFLLKPKSLTPAVKGKPQTLLQINLKEPVAFTEKLDSIFNIRIKNIAPDIKPSGNVKVLSEVVIKKVKTNQFNSPTAMHGALGTKIILDSTKTSSSSILEYISQNSRFQSLLSKAKRNTLATTNDNALPQKSIFDNLLILVNDQREFSDILDVIAESDVKYIDVLTGTEAAVYGSDAENGVLAIYTKSPNPIKINSNISNLLLEGYHSQKEFYQPKYNDPNATPITNDIRKALYWKPNVNFDLYGKAFIEFYTDDSNATYVIEIEGITENGNPFYATKEFTNQ